MLIVAGNYWLRRIIRDDRVQDMAAIAALFHVRLYWLPMPLVTLPAGLFR